jgi:hypothetical protein
MSSLAYGHEAASDARGAPRRRLATLIAEHGTDVLLGVVVAVFAIVLLVDVPKDFQVDSWLALADGRLVWQSGLPHHDFMNVFNHGGAWTDEQWLSQLSSYAIYRLGGLGLLGAVEVGLLVGSIATALAAARRRGASFRSVLVTIPMCAALISPSREIRTQTFAFPLFVALVCLLSADGRKQSRRVYWCLPILALWANLHGSATQGATLVLLYAATLLWQRRGLLLRELSAWKRPVALSAGSLVAIFITPYGLAMAGYYHSTLVNSTLRQFVSEWQPVTSSTPASIAFALLMGLALWSFGRNPKATTAWEKLALLMLAAGTFEVVRNAVFLGLLGLIVLPLSLGAGRSAAAAAAADTSAADGDRAAAAQRLRMRVNGGAAILAALGLLVALVSVVALPARTIEAGHQDPRMVTAVTSALHADPSLKVLADDHYSDYLLWKNPHLAGHLAADVRFELLSGAQLSRLESALSGASDYHASARGYRLIVLDRQANAAGIVTYRSEPGARVIFHDRDAVVVERSATQANR